MRALPALAIDSVEARFRRIGDPPLHRESSAMFASPELLVTISLYLVKRSKSRSCQRPARRTGCSSLRCFARDARKPLRLFRVVICHLFLLTVLATATRKAASRRLRGTPSIHLRRRQGRAVPVKSPQRGSRRRCRDAACSITWPHYSCRRASFKAFAKLAIEVFREVALRWSLVSTHQRQLQKGAALQRCPFHFDFSATRSRVALHPLAPP